MNSEQIPRQRVLSTKEAGKDDLETPSCSTTQNPKTILDVLHVYCWTAIFSYLPIEDIVRSERVCRQWQNLVHYYLQERDLRIEYPWLYRSARKDSDSKYRSILLKEQGKVNSPWFSKMTMSMGPSIVRADCIDTRSLMSIARNCNYIEYITVTGLQDAFLYDSMRNIPSLKSITFISCLFAPDLPVFNEFDTDVADVCIGKLLCNDSIEEIVIDSNKQVTGSCLRRLNESTKLKHLCIRYSINLNYQNLIIAGNSNRFANVTSFNLSGNPGAVLINVHRILDYMPKLEDLLLERYNETDVSYEVHEAIGRLARLKRLSLKRNENVTDDWLAAISRGCKQLQELHMQKCLKVTGMGLVKLCRDVGQTLTKLSAMDMKSMKDDHLAKCLSLCPKLVTLDVRGCFCVQETLVATARESRRTYPLRLRLWCTPLNPHKEKQPAGLILDFDSDDDYYYD